MAIAVEVHVKGRVQRVGFRREVVDTAQELGVVGNVKNLPDGSVRVFAQGEKRSVDEFVERLRETRSPISIGDFKVTKTGLRPRSRFFKIEYGSTPEELQEGFGAMESAFRDYREEFKDFAGRADQNFKMLFERYGEISEKMTKILEALVNESRETRKDLAEAMRKLAEAVDALAGSK